MPAIDTSHDCASCRAQSSEFYDLPGRCLNCGQRFTVRSRKGDKPPLSVECPACEVDEYSWRASQRYDDLVRRERERLAAAIRDMDGRMVDCDGSDVLDGTDCGPNDEISMVSRSRVLALLASPAQPGERE